MPVTSGPSWGLALSGGGLRATLFHLGIIRFLSEHRLLEKVSHITSVSGGSILAAHLVSNWSKYTNFDTFPAAAAEMLRFAGCDVRGRILRRIPSHAALSYVHKEGLLRFPPRLRTRGAIRTLLFERYLDRHLYNKRHLDEIARSEPGAPRLEILATNLTRGSLAIFTSDGFCPADGCEPIETRTRLSRAVAVSAAFPGFFPPVRVDADTLGTAVKDFPTVEYLTDGGVYDNLGVRRFQTLLKENPDRFEKILVCDASSDFDWLIHDEAPNVVSTALRATDILLQRMAELEREVAKLDAEPRFTLVQISAFNDSVPHQVRHLIKAVRTDLDRFSEMECATLQRHGHSMAAISISATAYISVAPKPWTPAEANAAKRHLEESRVRRSRLFSLRDPVSHMHILATLLLLLWPAQLIWNTHKLDSFLGHVKSLERDSFGNIKEVADPADLLAVLAAAEAKWPDNPETLKEIGLGTYSIISKGNISDPLKDNAFLQLGRVLRLAAPLELGETERVFHQLRGHYHLEEGRRRRAAGDREAAMESYRASFAAYEEFRKTFKGLYALDFNLCNTAEQMGNLDYALERCDSADRLARGEGVPFWQPKFVIGRIHLKRDQIEPAVNEFVDGLRIAASRDEAHIYKQFLQTYVGGWRSMCEVGAFAHEFPDLCSG